MEKSLFNRTTAHPMRSHRAQSALRLASILLLVVSFLASSTQAFAAPEPKLNLSSIGCSGRTVEVHFVVVNLPEGITPGALTFYGTWPGGSGSETIPGPTQISGPVYHYSWYGQSGYYEITGATVELSDGSTLSLHNPGDYTGEYDCHCIGMANCTGWTFTFMHPLLTDATITVYAQITGEWVQVGYGTASRTQNPTTVVNGSWEAPVPSRQTQIKFEVNENGRTHVQIVAKPDCTGGSGNSSPVTISSVKDSSSPVNDGSSLVKDGSQGVRADRASTSRVRPERVDRHGRTRSQRGMR